MRWWMIVLLAIGLIAFLLSFSVSFHILAQNGEWQVKLGFMGLTFRLYPPKKKARKKKKKTGKAVSSKPVRAQKAPPKEEKRSVKETILLTLDVIKSLINPTRFMLRHVRITQVDATVIAATDDAAQTAILYGELCGAIYGGVAALKNLVTVKVKNLLVGYDFNRKQTEYTVFFKVKLRGFVAVAAVLRMIYNLLANTVRRTAADREAQPAGAG